MKLDYNPATSAFILKAKRGEVDVQAIMRDHGLNFSSSASSADQAVLFTKEPYAAAAFGAYASPAAKEQLHGILKEIEASWAPTSGAHIRCPADKELWPYQKADIEYALRRKNTLVGDQPGLGKTPIAICFANEIRAKRALVICPASIRLQWVKRIREWSTNPWPHNVVHPILHSRHGVNPNADWTVVSYELARTEAIGKALAKGEYDVLILDEAHYCKSIDAGRTRAIFGGGTSQLFEPLYRRAEYILALTGTPLPNRPREAYTLARGMCWDSIDFASEEAFKDRFNPSLKREKFDPVTGKTKIWIDERSGRHAELQARLRANFMTRHLKRDVLTQLKMPVYDIIQLDETEAVKQALEAEKLLDIDPETFEGADFQAFGDISTVRKQMGIALAPQVADYVDMLIDGGEEKLVVFAWHHEVMRILTERWEKHGLRVVTGETSATRKAKYIKDFQEEPGVQIILGNLLSLGTGTDGLQMVSNHALIAEPSWVHGENEQAFDRLDRGGQTRTVQGDIFVAPNSFSEKILASSLRKGQTTHKALDHRL